MARLRRVIWFLSLFVFLSSIALSRLWLNIAPEYENFTVSLSDATIVKRVPLRFCKPSEIKIHVTVHPKDDADSRISFNGIFELTLLDSDGDVRWTRKYDAESNHFVSRGDHRSSSSRGYYIDYAPISGLPWERPVLTARVLRPDTSDQAIEATVHVRGEGWLFGEELTIAVYLALTLTILIPAWSLFFKRKRGSLSARDAEPAQEKLPIFILVKKSIGSPFFWAISLIPIALIAVVFLGISPPRGGSHGADAYAYIGFLLVAAILLPQFLILGLGCTMYARPFHLSRGKAFLAGLKVFGLSLIFAIIIGEVFVVFRFAPLWGASPAFWVAAFGLGRRYSSRA